MADLNEDQKLQIVRMLACFRDRAAIIAHFQSEHGLQIDHKQIGRYDPERRYFAGGERLRQLFYAQRKAFVEDVSAIPIAHRGYRLNMLQKALDAAWDANDWYLVAKLLQQAAKEVGGMYTSRRTIQIADDKPKAAVESAPEERRATVAALIGRVLVDAKGRKASEIEAG